MEQARLSVNINKIATLRNSRGGSLPNLLQVARDCERFGAQGITVHPRPDERHITAQDVEALKDLVQTEFNIEGYPNRRYLRLVEMAQPAQATLVPDSPEVLTSNQGWDAAANRDFLREVIAEIKQHAGRVSLFVDARPGRVEAAKAVGADRVELYTEPFAATYELDPEGAVKPFVEAAYEAHRCGLGLNAGHDLNLDNLRFFAERVPYLQEVSIGHALISDALYYGLENVIGLYKRQLELAATQPRFSA